MVIVVKRSDAKKRVISIIGGIVGILLGVGAFSIGWPMYLEHRADQEFLKQPNFQAIAKWEPGAYKQMKASAIEGLRHHENSAQIQGRIRSLVQKVAHDYMLTASDEALVDYLRVNIDEARQIAARDSDAGFAVLYTNKSDVDLTKYVDSATQQRDVAALAAIIQSGVAKEAGYQNNQRAQALLVQVVEGMRADFGADADLPLNNGRRKITYASNDPAAMMLAAMTPIPIDKPKANAMMIELLNRIVSLRTDQAAQVFRLVLSKS